MLSILLDYIHYMSDVIQSSYINTLPHQVHPGNHSGLFIPPDQPHPSYSNRLVNSGFNLIHGYFMSYGWLLTKNTHTHIEYTHPLKKMDIYTIKISKTNIMVNVPLKLSNHSYTTYFKGYFDANDYLEMHF